MVIFFEGIQNSVVALSKHILKRNVVGKYFLVQCDKKKLLNDIYIFFFFT